MQDYFAEKAVKKIVIFPKILLQSPIEKSIIYSVYNKTNGRS